MKRFFRVCSMLLILFSAVSIRCYAAQTADSVPPSAPVGLYADYRTSTSISLSWSQATDNKGVKGYQVFRDGRKIVTVTKTAYTNTSLVPGQAYTYMIKAYDAAGNVSEGGISLKVSTLPDVQAPSVPSGLSVSASDYTSASLCWEPSTDNTGVKTYEVYRDGVKVSSTAKTAYTSKSLTPGKKYVFTVRAGDVAGNFSAQSKSISVSTTADTSSPSVPEGLRASVVTETEITLVWDASRDNVKVKGYVIRRSDAGSVKSADGEHTFRNLTPGTKYTFTVSAYDASGNSSAAGKALTVTTVADTKAPTAPGNLQAKSAEGASVPLSWEASTDNIKVKGYNVYRNGVLITTTTRKTCTAKNPKGFGVYTYTVRAFDTSGNLSAPSKSVTVMQL